MYLTINRFRVKPGQEDAFEAMWVSRDSHLKSVEGFVSFHLMKGEEKDGHRLYLSHTLWRDRAAFEGWTKSEAFRQAHKGAKSSGEMYDGPPELEVFETISGTMATNSCLCIRSSKSSSFRSQRPGDYPEFCALAW